MTDFFYASLEKNQRINQFFLKSMLNLSLIFCFTMIVCILFACSGNINANKNPYENTLGIEPSVMAQMGTANYTTIEWIDTLVNLGKLKNRDTVSLSFRFKNTGSHPLYLLAVQPACGCTLADYSKEPVWNDREGIIRAVYTAKDQAGAVRKTIRVRTNSKNGQWHSLAFYGDVVADSVKQ